MSDHKDDTEDSILGNIPGLEDNTAEVSGGETTEATTTEASEAAATNSVGTPAIEGGESNTPAQPAAITRRDGLAEVPSKDNPGARDLVDPASGQVVARGGIERRIFEGAQRVHRDNQQLQQQLTQANQRFETANEVVKLGNSLNLSPQDQSASLQLMSDFLKNPVQMLERLVVEVKSKGYEIPFLTEGVSAGMDTAAIQRMMDQRMAPITQAREQQEAQGREQQEAKKTLDTFLDSNPEGEHNLTVLAEMITNQPGLTLDNAYVKLIKWCASNGLDYSQPLKPQIEARRAQQPATTTAQTPQQPRVPTVPLPNGRQPVSAVPINSAASFNESSSWADIIRQSMRESGMSAT